MQGRGLLAVACGALLGATLVACSPEIPVAYHVTGSTVDIAFCEYFDATSVEIVFSNYPPPGGGGMYMIAQRTFTGDLFSFRAGVPVAESLTGARWSLSHGSDRVPAGWERVDYSFYGPMHNFVAGQFLFSRDVRSTGWAWTTVTPGCELRSDET